MTPIKYPSDANAEMAILGGVMLDPRMLREIKHHVRPEMFTTDERRHLYSTMLELDKEGKPIDVMLIVDKLNANGGADRYGGYTGLLEFADSVPTAANLPHYADLVRKNSFWRSLIDAAGDIQTAAQNGGGELVTVLKAATELFNDYQAGDLSLDVGLKSVISRAAERVADRGSIIPWGHSRIDSAIGGLIKREPIVVGGRTSHMKTTFVTDRVDHWCGPLGQRVQIFSLEVAADMYVRSIVCQRAHLNYRAVQNHTLTRPQLEKFVHACNMLYSDYEDNLSIMDFTSGIKNPDILERAARKFKPDILVVDYIGLMPTSKQYKRMEIEEHMIFLKELCIDLDCAPIIVAQINRAPMKKLTGPAHPKLEDLKESGGIEENAAHVFLLYYHYTQTNDDKDNCRLRVHLAKNKYGPLGLWNLHVHPDFRNLTDLGYNRFDKTGHPAEVKRAITGNQ